MNYFLTAKTTTPSKHVDYEWLRDYISKGNFTQIDSVESKTDLPLVIPAGSKKRSDPFVQTDFVCIDIDDGLPMAQARRNLDADGLEYLLYTTVSHTPTKEKYRIVMPMDKPIMSPNDLLATLQILNVKYFDGKCDPAFLSNPNQGSFLPGVVGSVTPYVAVVRGQATTPSHMPAPKAKTTSEVRAVKAEAPISGFSNTVSKYLSHFNGADDRAEWINQTIKVVGSVQAGYIDENEAFKAWDTWCQTFDGYDPVANEKTWDYEMKGDHAHKAIEPATSGPTPVQLNMLAPAEVDEDHGWKIPEYDPNRMFEPIPYQAPFISDLIEQDESLMIYAQTGVGKSWVAMMMAVRLALGEDQQGSEGVRNGWQTNEPTKVMYIEGEMSERVVFQRFQQLCKGRDRATIMKNLEIRTTNPADLAHTNVADRACLQVIVDYCKGKGITCLILDNLSALFEAASGADENSAEYGKMVGQVVTRLKHEGITPVLIHHTGKEGSNYRGSSAIAQSFGTTLLLKKCEDFDTEINASWGYTLQKNRGGFKDYGSVTFNKNAISQVIAFDIHPGESTSVPKPGRKKEPIAKPSGEVAKLVENIDTLEKLRATHALDKDFYKNVRVELAKQGIESSDSVSDARVVQRYLQGCGQIPNK